MKKYFILILIVALSLSFFGMPVKADTYGPSLIGYWTFDSNGISGTTLLDQSGNGNNGPIIGGVVLTAGKLGQAESFNGTTQRASTSVPVALGGATVATMCGWMYRSVVTDKPVFGAGVTDTSRFNIQLNNDTKVYFTYGTTLNSQYASIVFNVTGWHHFCSVFNGSLVGNARAADYIDGIQKTMTYNSAPPAALNSRASLQAMFFGKESSNAFGKGFVDDVRVYSRALSAGEVAALYYQGISQHPNFSF